MSQQVVLLRVGIDSGSGGIQGPLFDDGAFEFICIPGDGEDTYGNTFGKTGRPWVDYFPEAKQRKAREWTIHRDPEFVTLTYGDPTAPKRGLRRLKTNDLLAFYCGLQRWDELRGETDPSDDPHLYLVGYFRVELAGMANDLEIELGDVAVRQEFRNNAHVRYPNVYQRDRSGLVLVKGGAGSRLFQQAHKISQYGLNSKGQRLKILSDEMKEHFGTFGGANSIQRSNPRWVTSEFVPSAVRFLESLS